MPKVVVLFCQGLCTACRSSLGYRVNTNADYLEEDGSIKREIVQTLYSVKRVVTVKLHPLLTMLDGLKGLFRDCSPLVKIECEECNS